MSSAPAPGGDAIAKLGLGCSDKQAAVKVGEGSSEKIHMQPGGLHEAGVVRVSAVSEGKLCLFLFRTLGLGLGAINRLVLCETS